MAACTLMAVASLFAPVANSEVRWLEKSYDFGLMKEEGGPKSGSVRFVNTGPDEVVITGARPSCGCTGVKYSDEPVAVGDTATVSFTYNPLGRPGRFDKSIRVYVGEYDTYTIKIRGTVLGTPESLSTLYPIDGGALRLSAANLQAGDMNYGDTRHFFINGYNQTADTIRPHWVCNDPALSITSSSPAVGPGDIVTFSFYFNSRLHPEMGHIETPVTIFSDTAPEAGKTSVSFSADINPDFSQMTPQEVKEAPRCYVAPPSVDLGELPPSAKKTLKFKFAIRNDGHSVMHVSRVYSRSEAVKITRLPATVKPGKSAEIEGSFDSSLLPAGAFNITIDILTDDPLHPVRSVSLIGIQE